jgi:hypothetical protein
MVESKAAMGDIANITHDEEATVSTRSFSTLLAADS